jgi:hypothetical protein
MTRAVQRAKLPIGVVAIALARGGRGVTTIV